MRQARNNVMVQTDVQYEFVYTCAGFFVSENKKPIPGARKGLARIAVEVERLLPTSETTIPERRRQGLDRYKDILSRRATNVTVDSANRYINGNWLFHINGRRVIATQGPLNTTQADFWKMVHQHHIGNIIMVAKYEEKEQTK